MITCYSLDNIPSLPQPISFTLGTFDTVHIGHQHLFSELKKRGTAVVLTFSNHPSEILSKNPTTPLLTLSQKLNLFEHYGIDLAIVLPFTQELASIPYDAFLQKISFSTLILGEGATFGYRGEGNETNVRKLDLDVIYLPKLLIDDEPVSSSRIRTLIQNGELDQAQKLLGRNTLW